MTLWFNSGLILLHDLMPLQNIYKITDFDTSIHFQTTESFSTKQSTYLESKE